MKSLPFVIATVALLSLVSCKDKDKKKSVNGEDFSGTYELAWVDCYSSSGSNTAWAVLASSSASSTTVIDGNEVTTTLVSGNGSCTVDVEGTIEFTETEFDSGVSSGTADMLQTGSSVIGGSSCTITYVLNQMFGPTISPTTRTETYSNSTQEVSSTVDYVRDADGWLYYPSTFSVSGAPSDVCFLVYAKI